MCLISKVQSSVISSVYSKSQPRNQLHRSWLQGVVRVRYGYLASREWMYPEEGGHLKTGKPTETDRSLVMFGLYHPNFDPQPDFRLPEAPC